MTLPAGDKEAVENHLFHCRQYMDNALEALRKDEPGKAGEMLWGSVTQAVHAVDAWRGAVITDHRRLLNFATQIGREIDDPYFPNNFESAKSLHSNFYIPAETREEVEALVPGIRRAIDQILGLLPEDVRNGITGV